MRVNFLFDNFSIFYYFYCPNCFELENQQYIREVIINNKMSLTKNNNNSGSVSHKKNFNLTTQVADVLMTMSTKKGTWKSKTSKLIKTLTNKGCQPNSNLMTEDDIDKLFGKCKLAVQNAITQNKISTEIPDVWVRAHNRTFTNNVKFLKMEDETDKFLTGIPQDFFQQDRIDQLFKKNQQNQQFKDLTAEFKKNYLVGKIIGEGAYASVRVAIYKPLEKKIAIKIYQKSKIKEPQRKKSVRRQITILSLLQHPNIVKILDVVETNNHLNIVMQYLSGTSLGSFLKSHQNNKLPEKNCKKIFQQLTRALKFMHAMNIAHRDIKLENIILDDELHPKIIDFGFSTCIQSDKKIKIFCGTPSYMAPEVVQRKQYRGQSADIWALGVMLFVCLTGIFPFKGATDQQLYKKINNADYPKGQLLFSRQISDLISRMLRIDPEQRITANQLLKHPWFAELSSSKKKNTEGSLENNRKRINTQNSNQSKENKWAHKTGIIKKTLAETTGNENLKLQIRMALKSPKMRQQINSFRVNNKQNTLKMLKSQKTTYRAKINEKNDKEKQKLCKTHSKVIDLLKLQMKKKQSDKSKNKKKI